eukprot:GHUV01046372.1.p1 GENE.GHUV01046372.1~~GHUV01046372.1.p1  ORF type:complete len:119 (+),score=12.14 GHUV01046372.1:323-679(+)
MATKRYVSAATIGYWMLTSLHATHTQHAEDILAHAACCHLTTPDNPSATYPVVHMHQWFIPHEQRTHNLQGWNLQWEVEWCNECHGPVWPPHTLTGLTHVVTGVAETPGKESDLQQAT